MRVNPRSLSCDLRLMRSYWLSCDLKEFESPEVEFYHKSLDLKLWRSFTTLLKTCLQHDRVWTTAKPGSNEKESWQELVIVDMSSISRVLSVDFYALTGLCSPLILSNSVFTAACKTWVFKRDSPAMILLWLPIVTNCWWKFADLTVFFMIVYISGS